MPLPLRRYYGELLVKSKEEESKQYEEAMKKTSDPRVMKS
jgi:hypothetical protein|tara:strand:- start:525 stop:644 length:120 start_codon:yes stop_codon:yes gene_type:complete